MKRIPAPEFYRHLQFVTTRTSRRLPLLRQKELCREFLQALIEVRRNHHLELFAYVIMSDHVHLVVCPDDGHSSALMRKIKSLSAHRIVKSLKVSRDGTLLAALKKSTLGRKRHAYQVWQDGFHAVPLWSEWMIQKKIDYIHANPLRKGLVKSAKDYLWSSFSTYHRIGRGRIPLDPIPS